MGAKQMGAKWPFCIVEPLRRRILKRMCNVQLATGGPTLGKFLLQVSIQVNLVLPGNKIITVARMIVTGAATWSLVLVGRQTSNKDDREF